MGVPIIVLFCDKFVEFPSKSQSVITSPTYINLINTPRVRINETTALLSENSVYLLLIEWWYRNSWKLLNYMKLNWISFRQNFHLFVFEGFNALPLPEEHPSNAISHLVSLSLSYILYIYVHSSTTR